MAHRAAELLGRRPAAAIEVYGERVLPALRS
jgi:hypothetical protein